MGFDAIATCIGSFPHLSPAEICDTLVRRLGDCPAWPQLPRRDARENMYAQYARALPGARIDPDDGKVILDSSGDFAGALTRFYEQVLGDNLAGFGPDAETAAGFQVLLSRLEGLGSDGFVKGQITGPISFGLQVTDVNDRPVLYDETLRDVVVQGLTAQARAQCRSLGRSGRKVILFVDEPYLSSVGSATIPVSEADVIECIDAVTSAILAEGALPGVHCCGNTNWSLLTRTSARIISFDAYNFMEGMTLYPVELAGFFAKGGALAWGIVPTDAEALARSTAIALSDRLEAGLARLAAGMGHDPDLLRHHSLITPGCGAGTLSVDLAERAITLTREVSDELRRRWRFS